MTTVKAFRETRTNEQLASQHVRLVWHVAHKFAKQVRRGTESANTIAEELASVGWVIMAKCLRAYNRDLGIKFSTLLTIALQREFSNQLQLSHDRQKRGLKRFPGALAGLDVDGCLSIDYEGGEFDGVPVRQCYEARVDDGSDWNPTESARRFRLALRSMPRRYVDILIDRYILGRRLHQIGRTHGVSKERIRQLLKLAVRIIQKKPYLMKRVAMMGEPA